jgi:hypothetical protein
VLTLPLLGLDLGRPTRKDYCEVEGGEGGNRDEDRVYGPFSRAIVADYYYHSILEKDQKTRYEGTKASGLAWDSISIFDIGPTAFGTRIGNAEPRLCGTKGKPEF